MTEYKEYENKTLTIKDAKMRKTRVNGQTRYSKYILAVEAENIDSMSMKLEDYYIEEFVEDVQDVEFNTEEAEKEPLFAEDIPDIVLKIQKHLNKKDEVTINATITVAQDEDSSNWFINPENFGTIEVITDE